MFRTVPGFVSETVSGIVSKAFSGLVSGTVSRMTAGISLVFPGCRPVAHELVQYSDYDVCTCNGTMTIGQSGVSVGSRSRWSVSERTDLWRSRAAHRSKVRRSSASTTTRACRSVVKRVC